MTRGYGDGVDVEQTMAGVIVVLFLSAIAAMVLFACGAGGAIKSGESETVYLAQQLRCVEKYNRREDIDTCRMHVRERWGIHDTSTDSGVP